MQRRIGDRNAADKYRLKPRDRCNRSHAPNLKIDGEHLRAFLLGWELPGDRPTRTAGGLTEFALQFQPIDLDHRAVDFIIEIRAFSQQAAAIVETCIGIGAELTVGIGFQSPSIKQCESLEQCFRQIETFHDAKAVAIHPQRKFRGIARIELANGARRGIARIDIGFALFLPGSLIQFGESPFAKENFAADLDAGAGKAGSRQAQWNVANGADIVRDVFAVDTVSARRAAFEQAAAVHKTDRDAIDLGFATIFDRAFNARPL